MPHPKIRIEMLPAGNGDSFLLHLGKSVWLIDSGYIHQTYSECLNPRLKALKEDGGRLSRLIITHIDSDHISGAVKFLEENGSADNPSIIPIDQVWHNSYRHIQFKNKMQGKLTEETLNLVRQRTRKAHLKEDVNKYGGPVSVKQGSTLARCIYEGRYNWNTDFDGKAVSTEKPYTFEVGEGIQLVLLTPNKACLEKLASKWKKELKRNGYLGELNEDQYFDDALEFLMAGENSPILHGGPVLATSKWIEWILSRSDKYQEDTSATNGSSISFLLEYSGKKLLFLGDAIPSLVVKQLKAHFLEQGMEISKRNPLEVNVLKLSHHGSFTNNSPELLELVAAEHYLISTNGKRHHHPHLETIAWLINSHRNVRKHLYFNYDHCLNRPGGNPQQERLKKIMEKSLWDAYKYKVFLPEVEGYREIVL